MGSVNATTVVSPTIGLSFAPETLLYTPPTLSRSISTDVIEAWRAVLTFQYKASGWNKFWRIDAIKADGSRGDWAHMYHKNDLVTPYRNHPLMDFSPMGVVVAVEES